MRRSAKSIFIFWVPLAGTWLMMAFEGPFLAAIIARLPDPLYNLAAHGVAVAFAILVEAPVIMIMTASTALVTDASSFRKLRNYTYGLNAAITGAMLVVVTPAVFRWFFQGIIGLPDDVARLTYGALLILLPWPAAIGYRRFFQGLLIRAGLTRLVAYGTLVRLAVMTSTTVVLFVVFALPGAYVGAAALSAGVCFEAVASRLMARRTVRKLLGTHDKNAPPAERLNYRRITHFYYPLALTSIVGLAVHPMLTFFMGRARFPLESLAVFPVVHALSFVFRALGLSYQEVAIALMGKDFEHYDELRRFAFGLGIAASAALALIAFTPLAGFWFETVSGLSPELASFAIVPVRILAPFPALSVLLSFQRGVLVQGRHTGPITGATVVEVAGIAIAFVAFSNGLDLVGVTAAMIAFVVGRTASNAYLVPATLRVLENSRRQAS
ncbi:MAG: hypothetical protein IH878_15005 [Gemmatimonadetes bacterium]|nr:hypothetical protein [Gemmatimonadota bacterium]